jgi:hypothetical protein
MNEDSGDARLWTHFAHTPAHVCNDPFRRSLRPAKSTALLVSG